MQLGVDGIITLASLLSALGAIIGIIIAVYKFVEMDARQTAAIKRVEEEQTIICYGLKGALEGLIEQGCDGPCKDALGKLEKHLNQSAHRADL